MKTLPLILLVLIFTLCASPASAQQAGNFQIDTTHTGSSSEPLVPPLKQRWVRNFGQPISYPLIADGRVFATVRNASGGTTLHALDSANGTTIWSFVLDTSFSWSAASYENGRVFAINRGGLLRAFDAANGAVIWSVQLPNQFFFSAPPTVHQGVVYTSGSGSGGTVYAVNASTGALLWTKSVVNGDRSSPAVTSDGLYVSYACPNVYKLNPATGAQVWFFTPGLLGRRRQNAGALQQSSLRSRFVRLDLRRADRNDHRQLQRKEHSRFFRRQRFLSQRSTLFRNVRRTRSARRKHQLRALDIRGRRVFAVGGARGQ